jgi:ribonuclease HI
MLQNGKIHTNIIEDIRRQWYRMKKAGWQIALHWVKAHVDIRGNELADTLAKKAATSRDIMENYTRIPKRVVQRQLEEESGRKAGVRQLKAT